jgi:hypothetical protein
MSISEGKRVGFQRYLFRTEKNMESQIIICDSSDQTSDLEARQHNMWVA